ncbi:MAG: hypothetical protein ABIO72_03985 [Patescibacteria group bacterium]
MFPASVLAKHLTSVIANRKTDPKQAPQGAVRQSLAFFHMAKHQTGGLGVAHSFGVASYRLIEMLVPSASDVARMLGIYNAITSRLVIDWTIPESGLAHLQETQGFFDRLHCKGQQVVQKPLSFGLNDGTVS